MFILFAQEKPVAIDWFQNIIQGGSFALVAFIVLFMAYFMVKEWPKIRKEQRDENATEREEANKERQLDRDSRHAMAQGFQTAITETAKMHIDAYKEQRVDFNNMLARQEEKREREIDKVIAAMEKQLERTMEYVGDQIQTAVCKGGDNHKASA